MFLKEKIQTFTKLYKYKYSPIIPTVDYTKRESRINWILYMAHRTGRMPVREVINKMESHVSKVTINKDIMYLEEQKLIKREKDEKRYSYIIPLIEDEEETSESVTEKSRELLLDYGLPSFAFFLFAVLLMTHIINL